MQHPTKSVPNSISSSVLLNREPYSAVLMRDGTDVVTNSSSCAAISGNWVSPYDNVTTTLASDLDIVSQLYIGYHSFDRDVVSRTMSSR